MRVYKKSPRVPAIMNHSDPSSLLNPWKEKQKNGLFRSRDIAQKLLSKNFPKYVLGFDQIVPVKFAEPVVGEARKKMDHYVQEILHKNYCPRVSLSVGN